MIELLDPTAEVTAQAIAYVDRARDSRGQAHRTHREHEVQLRPAVEKIGEILKAEYGVAETRMFRKHNASVPAHEEIIVEVRKELRRHGRRDRRLRVLLVGQCARRNRA